VEARVNKSQVPPIKDFDGLKRAWSHATADPPQRNPAGQGETGPAESSTPTPPEPVSSESLTSGKPSGAPQSGAIDEFARVLLERDEALLRKDEEIRRLAEATAAQASELEFLRRKTEAYGILKKFGEDIVAERAALERDRSAFERELDQLDAVAERERQVVAREDSLASREREQALRAQQVGDFERLRAALQRKIEESAAKDLQRSAAADTAQSLDARCTRLERAQTDLVRALAEARHQHERALVAGRDARGEASRRQAEAMDLRERLAALETQGARDAMALRALRSETEALKAKAASKPEIWTSNVHLLNWLLQDATRQAIGLKGKALGWSGSGPFADEVLDPALTELGFNLVNLAHETISHVVVGRTGWSQGDLLEQIDARQGKTLRVYSQEMLVAALLTGIDPLDSQDDELLYAFKAGHPAREFLAGEAFRWPAVTVPDTSTVASLSAGDLGVPESPLHLLGYKVGATSPLEARDRRDLLRLAFEDELPFVESKSYMSRWGTRRSHQRLWRIATHIAHLINGPVGRDFRKPQARRDWISDLHWLKTVFYKPRRFRFTWPDIEVVGD